MTADPLADLLHDEFHGGDDADDLWVDWKNDVSHAQADAIRAALRDGTLSPEDLGMDPVTLFVRGDDGIARQITAYLPQEAPDA